MSMQKMQEIVKSLDEELVNEASNEDKENTNGFYIDEDDKEESNKDSKEVKVPVKDENWFLERLLFNFMRGSHRTRQECFRLLQKLPESVILTNEISIFIKSVGGERLSIVKLFLPLLEVYISNPETPKDKSNLAKFVHYVHSRMATKDKYITDLYNYTPFVISEFMSSKGEVLINRIDEMKQYLSDKKNTYLLLDVLNKAYAYKVKLNLDGSEILNEIEQIANSLIDRDNIKYTILYDVASKRKDLKMMEEWYSILHPSYIRRIKGRFEATMNGFSLICTRRLDILLSYSSILYLDKQNQLLKDMIKYAPEGSGAIEAEEHFKSLINKEMIQ